jgi:uncharacterized protein (DUF433 family)
MKTIRQVVVNPDVCHGKPTLKGTRVMVSNVLSVLAGGYTIAQVAKYYPELSKEDVKAAIEYAAATIDEEIILTAAGS